MIGDVITIGKTIGIGIFGGTGPSSEEKAANLATAARVAGFIVRTDEWTPEKATYFDWRDGRVYGTTSYGGQYEITDSWTTKYPEVARAWREKRGKGEYSVLGANSPQLASVGGGLGLVGILALGATVLMFVKK